jgi:hypothetical protein
VDEALRMSVMGRFMLSSCVAYTPLTSRLADYVVLADDPYTIDPEKNKDVAIVRTVVDGSTAC